MAAASYIVFVICLALCHTSLSDVVVDDLPPVVESGTTTYRGKRININPYQLPDFHGAVAAYTRIPYAEPPVGDLRFRRPVPKVIEGEFDATRGPITCPQMTVPGMDFGLEWSEDCLFLDVFVPEPKPKSAAVMVWIHGGGFHTGAGSVPQVLPTSLAAMNDVIVVTCNYRLNVFGFLSSGDEEIVANVGLLDQRQVLIWVKENIAAFGGDPNRVTIFGESAGAASVHFQVLSPLSAGLFTGAVMQSGVATAESYTTQERAKEMAFSLGSKMNCTATTSTKELAECLRAISAEDMVAHFIQDPMAMIETAVRPVIDGDFLPKTVNELTADGSYNHVNILMGTNEDEGNIFVSPVMVGGDGSVKPVIDEPTFQGLVAANLQMADPLVIDMVSFVYVSQEELDKPEPDYADAGAMFMSDYIFVCDTFAFAERFADADQQVYVYFLKHVPSSSMWGSGMNWMGATHGEDIPYVFGSPFKYDSKDDVGDSFLVGFFDEEEVQMSLQVMKYWSNFAKTGNPNLSSKDGEPDSMYPSWPNFTRASPTFKEISKTFTNADKHPTPKRCDFKLNHLPKLVENAAELARLKSLLEENVNADSEKSCEDPASCPGE